MSRIDNDGQAVAGGLQTILLYEKRKVIYAREVKGWWAGWRWAMVWITQLVFYGLPWLEWNGRQAVLFNIVERKFFLFGLVLWPQDVFYLAILLIISAFALFLFTAIAGRVFCGYVCPQTVYTKIFMWIENRIEGERAARIKLDRAPRTLTKIGVKAVKHSAWLAVSLWTGFTLVAYFTPVTELLRELPFGLGGWEFFWAFFYGGFCYLQAGFMREQVCKYMCPYARFQGVMFDPDTLIISYDSERGEPRGARLKTEAKPARKSGDCIDCGLCIQVCPTGIDIRNGLQYECIGCGACVDACDGVMSKIGLPEGLVRYSTENALAQRFGRREILAHVLRWRTMLYSGILLAMVLALGWSLANRIPLKVDVIRDRATLAREADDGQIENIYILKIMNTSETPRRFSLSVGGLEGIEIVGEREVEIPATENREITVNIRAPGNPSTSGVTQIFFDIRAIGDDTIVIREKASFLFPR